MGGAVLVITQFAFNVFMASTLKISNVKPVQLNVYLVYQPIFAMNAKMDIL